MSAKAEVRDDLHEEFTAALLYATDSFWSKNASTNLNTNNAVDQYMYIVV